MKMGLAGRQREEQKGFSYFDFKGSFESTSKEPSEGADERGKSREGNAVNLEGVHPDCFLTRTNEISSDACKPRLITCYYKKKKKTKKPPLYETISPPSPKLEKRLV